MLLTTRGRRQVITTLFPRNFWTYRNLSMQVPDDGIESVALPFSKLIELLPIVINDLNALVANKPIWRQFSDIDADKIELVEPVAARVDVSPTSWWCTSCHRVFSGPVQEVGIKKGMCPACHQKRVVQLAMLFMCPICHITQPVEAAKCPECNDRRNVILVGRGGRRRDYQWRCNLHPSFGLQLVRRCQRDNVAMVLKSTGGRLYGTGSIKNVRTAPINGSITRHVGNLLISPARATVIDVVLGRIPIADPNAYYAGNEFSEVEPFRNPHTGNYMGLVSRIETDAITISSQGNELNDPVTLHSLKHALLNAAPAVTGLSQEEFGAAMLQEKHQLVLYDNVAGGTGGSRLLADRRLDRWFQVARELAECHLVQCEDACRGCLFLPSRVCTMNNHDLDRHRLLDLIPSIPE